MTWLIYAFTFLFLISCAHKLDALYDKFDRDGDKKITTDDEISPEESFKYKNITAQGTYHISNLAQELKFASEENREPDPLLVFENPVDRISRLIREKYWDGLTRRIDGNTLLTVIEDDKIKSPQKFLYVPYDDHEAFSYYKSFEKKDLKVLKLPKRMGSGFVTSLGQNQGLLSLKLGAPYVVPGGRFNEMYGWDSYFHVLGTIEDKRLDLAKGMVDNFVYEINHYGKILNANRTYYLSRSQPPFLTSMIREVYEKLPKNEETKKWLVSCLEAALKEYETVWMGPERLTPNGLSRYGGVDQGIPPEVEPTHFDHILEPYAKKYQVSVERIKKLFNEGKIQEPALVDFFHQDRAVRESGHDTTYRWRVGEEDRASDFVTVDLNSLLYKYEMDLATLIRKEFSGNFMGHTEKKFQTAALKRKILIRKYLWNPRESLFFDYNWKKKKLSSYISATTFYPLWAGEILTKVEAQRMVKAASAALEEAGGLSATAKKSLESTKNLKEQRQWDYPNGWAPHQILAWQGLINYGYEQDAERLAYKWLYMITRNAVDYHGTIPEKYDVVSRSHKVFAEYGNVGTDFSYITKEGFGWMNASYQLGLKVLSKEKLNNLKDLIAPK